MQVRGIERSTRSTLNVRTVWLVACRLIAWQQIICERKFSNLKIGRYPLHEHFGFYLWSKLSVTGNVKYLDFSVDPQLECTAHINAKVSIANARVCLIHRCFISRERLTLIKV